MLDEFVEKPTEDTKVKDISTETEDEVSKNLHLNAAEEIFVPFGVRSFADLDAAEAAEEATGEVHDDSVKMVQIVENILNDIDDDNKAGSIAKVASEFSERVSDRSDQMKSGKGLLGAVVKTLKDAIANNTIAKANADIDKNTNTNTNTDKDIPDSIKTRSTFHVWKDKSGRYAWIAKYSNNFRDDDSPPEIISEKSHQRFINSVPAQHEYPELRLWHRPEWVVGKSTWLAWDDTGNGTGFALAAGYFNKGMESVAEGLAQAHNLGVSHGMPKQYLRRDKGDPTIITQHVTKEVSILPLWSAANRWTEFIVIDEKDKEKNMSISDEQRQWVKDDLDLDENVLAQIEATNKETAAKNRNLKIDFKAKDDSGENSEGETNTEATTNADTEANTEADTTNAENTDANTEDIDVDKPPTRKEIADAMIELRTVIVKEVTTAVTEQVIKQLSPFTDVVKELARDDDERLREKLGATPRVASLTDILNESITTADKANGLSDKEAKELGAPKETVAGDDNTFIGALTQGKGDEYLADVMKNASQPAQ